MNLTNGLTFKQNHLVNESKKDNKEKKLGQYKGYIICFNFDSFGAYTKSEFGYGEDLRQAKYWDYSLDGLKQQIKGD